MEDLLSILAKTKEKSSVLVGFVEEVCFRHLSSAQIPPSVISSASLAARKEELGEMHNVFKSIVVDDFFVVTEKHSIWKDQL